MQSGIQASIKESVSRQNVPAVTVLERALEARFGARHVVAVASGTAALHAALHVSGVGRGDEVIVPALSPTCIVMPVIATGAKVVVCDVDGTLNPSVSHLKEAVTPRTRAMLVVHRFGHLAPVYDYATAVPGIHLIEDCAQSFSVGRGGHTTTPKSLFAAFSFGGTKVLGVGAGGALAVNDELTMHQVRRFIGLGADHDGEYRGFGLNYEMPEAIATLALEALSRVDDILRVRRDACDVVLSALCPDLFAPAWSPPPGVEPCLHSLVLHARVPIADAVRVLGSYELECNVLRPRTLFAEPVVISAMRADARARAMQMVQDSYASTVVLSAITLRLTDRTRRAPWAQIRRELVQCL